ncbi:MAG: CvpA family protein [Bacillota bacterium]|nr:CvpA family protein [Bacillota bacterium]
MNWVDWVIAAVISLTAFGGLRRGFVKTIARLASQIGALVAAFVLTRPVSFWLEEQFGLAGQLGALLARYIQLPADFGRTTLTNLSSGQLWSMLDGSGLPEQFKDAVMTWVADSPAQANMTLARFIQDSLGMLVLSVLTFIGLMVITRILIGIVGQGVSGTVNAMGAGALDHLGGLAFGVAQGVLVCALVLGLGMPLLSVQAASGLADAVRQSRLAPPLLNAFYEIIPWLRQIGQSIWKRPL